MFKVVCHQYSMFKLIFDKDVNFLKKTNKSSKGGDFEIGALDSYFIFVNIKILPHWRPSNRTGNVGVQRGFKEVLHLE